MLSKRYDSTYNIASEFYENIYFSNWRPYIIAEKNWDKWNNFNIIPNGKWNFVFKQCPPPPPPVVQVFPLKHDYIFIKEVDTPNGISYHGGTMSYTTFDTWGRGGGGVRVTRY